MLDFVSVHAIQSKKGAVDIVPEFIVKKSKDLMIRGRAFYAIWDEERGLWSRSEDDAQRLIDKEIYEFAKEYDSEGSCSLKLLSNFSSKKWTEFQLYCKSLPDNYHDLDDRIIFANTKFGKTDYVSRALPYALESGPCPAYEELVSTIYDPAERRKIEWAIGSIIQGDSRRIQKFLAMYGNPGSGKSTMLKIIQKLFEGYWIPFDSKSLGVANNTFALENFRTNPLVAIQHEGDLSKVEDNTRINSIVSHETMVVNEKFKSPYPLQFKTFLILATNKPVRITDAKSGLIRRLIDVSPSGRTLPPARYDVVFNQINFELGQIANYCLEVYQQMGPKYYDHYIPISMMSATNEFYNFMEDNYEFWKNDHPEGITLSMAWIRYKEYCADANIPYPYRKMVFKEELKNYFREYTERKGQQYNLYEGFLSEKFEYKSAQQVMPVGIPIWLTMDKKKSLFDTLFASCPAQYANDKETPGKKWVNVTTKLQDLDTSKLHYVKVPRTLVVIDFDLKNQKGEKDLQKNLEAASKWPPTYAELSKSGSAIHLHYIYEGDVSLLSRIYEPDIEVKTFTGDSSLRRCLSLCNDVPIRTISSGLPLKEIKPVLKEIQIKSEKKLREQIKRSLRKEVHGHTKPEVDFIHHILEEAYESGLKYDVTDLRSAIQTFAFRSSHQADYCIRMVGKMKFRSEEPTENVETRGEEIPIVFFDVEVFPNLFIVIWKKLGEESSPVSMVNPTADEIEHLTHFRLVGFNNRRYDNHILYARMMGYTELQLFELSQRIINGDRDAFFREAYNLSYTDIYDFMSSSNKMSLKKWEIKLHIHHQELGYAWDQPVPQKQWEAVADYCKNDVIATEAVWSYKDVQADWLAREILALLSGLTVNDTTNQHTTRIIVGNDRNPQSQFLYTDLSTIYPGYRYDGYGIPKEDYIPGTKIVSGKSIYRGEDPGEGGYAFANPGTYINVPVLDIASMHPHSAIQLAVFGEEYTKRFENIVEGRVAIKHKDYERAKQLLIPILNNEDQRKKLDKYLSDPEKAKALANALKTAINSVYGLTSAKFENKLRDPRNKDNIIAKYGALFMINLKREVENRGFTVVHIKTDSIKIANANNDIIQFVMDYGKKYGYTFEHECTYRKMCIVNDAVYIAQYEDKEICLDRYHYIPEENAKHSMEWTATGEQFKVPYVFKTLFSKEPLEFYDLCETKSVSTALYLDMNEKLPSSELLDQKIKKMQQRKNKTGVWTEEDQAEYDRLMEATIPCHDYRFVGRVGQFCPILPGNGGGILLRQGDDGKFSAVEGTKKKGSSEVYRWMESEMVRNLGLEKQIDLSYYNALVDDAVDTISKFGDFEQFVADDRPPMSRAFLEIGKDMSSGLSDGMMQKLPEVSSAIKEIVKEAI